jgi:hypothetical protein
VYLGYLAYRLAGRATTTPQKETNNKKQNKTKQNKKQTKYNTRGGKKEVILMEGERTQVCDNSMHGLKNVR